MPCHDQEEIKKERKKEKEIMSPISIVDPML
jgi:hypothetical protein